MDYDVRFCIAFDPAFKSEIADEKNPRHDWSVTNRNSTRVVPNEKWIVTTDLSLDAIVSGRGSNRKSSVYGREPNRKWPENAVTPTDDESSQLSILWLRSFSSSKDNFISFVLIFVQHSSWQFQLRMRMFISHSTLSFSNRVGESSIYSSLEFAASRAVSISGNYSAIRSYKFL